jgi:hypothetical protein
MLLDRHDVNPSRLMSSTVMDERCEQLERLDAACAYAIDGHPVFPVWWAVDGVCACPLAAKCKDAGKHPIGDLVPRGKDDATTNIDRIFEWWLKCPLANIGVRCDNLIVFDIDPRNGGNKTLREQQAENGRLTATVHQRSGNGWHVVYDATSADLSRLKNKGRGGIDLKVDSRGYFIAAPSIHANGKRYRWIWAPKRLGKKSAAADEKVLGLAEWISAGEKKSSAHRRVLAAPKPDHGGRNTGLKDRLWRIAHFGGIQRDEYEHLAWFEANDIAPDESDKNAKLIERTWDNAQAEQGNAPDRKHAAELERLRARTWAAEELERERAEAEFEPPEHMPTLADELAADDEPLTYTINELHVTGGNTLLLAQYKTGKSTLTIDLARCAADGAPFLERFDTTCERHVGILNLEMMRVQHREWCRRAGFEHPERAAVVHVRGQQFNIEAPSWQDWIVEWLKRADIGLWILDTWTKLYHGPEYDNTHAQRVLDTLDEIKERAGVDDVVLTCHTPRSEMARGKERARGPSALDGWADTRWGLTEQDGSRYLWAGGRIDGVDELRLEHDPATGRSTAVEGDRKTDHAKVADGTLKNSIRMMLRKDPSLSANDLVKRTGGKRTKVLTMVREVREELGQLDV